MRDVVIVEPVRTAVGGFGGSYKDVHAHVLGAAVVEGLMARTGPAEGQGRRRDLRPVLPQRRGAGDRPGRGARRRPAGRRCSGLQIDRRCGSGLQAVIDAAMQVQTGACDLVLAGGVESMSQAEFYSDGHRAGAARATLHDAGPAARAAASPPAASNHPVPGGMLETAENLRRDYQHRPRGAGRSSPLIRIAAPSLRSRRRFAEEIVPVRVKAGKASPTWRSRATSIRAPTPHWNAWPGCARSWPAATHESTVTAGNASGQNDGAAVCIVTDPRDRRAPGPASAGVGWCPGRLPAWSPAAWASARCRPPRWRCSAPACRSTTWT